jgi:transglutaminase-like putative cysteine protease
VAATGAFLLAPQPPVRPLAGAIISVPGIGPLSGELEAPAVPLLLLTENRAGGRNLDLRYRGRLGADVVFSVRTVVSAYWQGQVFDRYRDGAWTTSRRDVQTLPPSTGQGGLPATAGLGVGTYFVQVFRIVRPLPNAILGAEPVDRVFYPSTQVRRDHYGTFWAPEPLRPGTIYSAVSHLPAWTPEGLRREADGPNDVEPQYLEANQLSKRARALALQVTSHEQGRYQKVAALTAYLQVHYRYTVELGRTPPGHDPIEWFLFDRRAGYCEQFATAEILMLRSLGIPARLVTGYAPGEYSSVLKQAVVRERDAHAWVEVSFPGNGWVPVDPSPGYAALPAARFPASWPALNFLGAVPHLTLGAVSGVLGLSSLAWLMVAVGVAAALVLVAQVAHRARQRPRRQPVERLALLAVYERLQRRLGRRRAPPETPREYRDAIAASDSQGLLHDVTEAVNRGAYAGRWPTRAEVDGLHRRLRSTRRRPRP